MILEYNPHSLYVNSRFTQVTVAFTSTVVLGPNAKRIRLLLSPGKDGAMFWKIGTGPELIYYSIGPLQSPLELIKYEDFGPYMQQQVSVEAAIANDYAILTEVIDPSFRLR